MVEWCDYAMINPLQLSCKTNAMNDDTSPAIAIRNCARGIIHSHLPLGRGDFYFLGYRSDLANICPTRVLTVCSMKFFHELEQFIMVVNLHDANRTYKFWKQHSIAKMKYQFWFIIMM